MSIKKLDTTSVSKICVNQVVVDMPMCIKELVENSLDAGATKIDVIFYEHGSTGIRVSDNGSGIKMENFGSFTQKGATSKIGDFDDISKLVTYGFRGEALNAISRLSELKITTKTAEDDHGWELSFDNEFNLSSTKDVNKAEIGTDIYLQNLFRNLPVRYQEFKTNYKTQFTNSVSLLENYALISTEAKITVVNSTRDKPWDVILSNSGPNPRVRDNILAVLGKKIFETLGEVKIETDYFKMDGYATKSLTSGSMKSSYKKDMLYFFVNKRPVNLNKKFVVLLSQIYRQHNPNAKYLVILNLTIAPEEYDINISPDKKEIVFKKPNEIYNEFKKFFEGYLEENKAFSKMLPEPETQKKLNFKRVSSQNLDLVRNEADLAMKEEYIVQPQIQSKKRKYEEYASAFNQENIKKVKLTDISLNNLSELQKSDSGVSDDRFSYSAYKAEKERDKNRNNSGSDENEQIDTIYKQYKTRQHSKKSDFGTQNSQQESFSRLGSFTDDREERKESRKSSPEAIEEEYDTPSFKLTEIKLPGLNLQKIELSAPVAENASSKKKVENLKKIQVEPPAPVENKQKNKFKYYDNDSEEDEIEDVIDNPPANFLSTLQTIKVSDYTNNNANKPSTHQCNHHQDSPPKSEKSSISKNFEKKATLNTVPPSEKDSQESEQQITKKSSSPKDDAFIDKMIETVSRTFRKNQFLSLFLVGQFNLGFIVCILPEANEIFIIDQHAADEKFNFERFMRDQKIVSQHLIAPLPITLPQTHLLLLRENVNIVEKNGFKVKTYQDSEGMEVLKISALPMIKDVTFKENDLQDLLTLIEANPFEKDEARIPKIKNVLASKACRASIMIGDPLKMSEMKQVVHNLSTLKSPWNCPHGRPTLITLGGLDKKINQLSKSRPFRPYNFQNLS